MPSGHVPPAEGSTHTGGVEPESNGGCPTTMTTQISFAEHDAQLVAASRDASVRDASVVGPASESTTHPQLETLKELPLGHEGSGVGQSDCAVELVHAVMQESVIGRARPKRILEKGCIMAGNSNGYARGLIRLPGEKSSAVPVCAGGEPPVGIAMSRGARQVSPGPYPPPPAEPSQPSVGQRPLVQRVAGS